MDEGLDPPPPRWVTFWAARQCGPGPMGLASGTCGGALWVLGVLRVLGVLGILGVLSNVGLTQPSSKIVRIARLRGGDQCPTLEGRQELYSRPGG